MSYRGCEHVQDYKPENLYQFTRLYASVIACSSERSFKIKADHSLCFKCRRQAWRLHACLFCVYIGCYEAKHIHDHADIKSHCLAADLDHGTVYCFLCKDYVYDYELERIAAKLRRKSAEVLGIRSPWKPPCLEILKTKQITVNSHLGLRGLCNLGSTCFANSILQIFMHAPMLRDYFLSSQHSCQFTTISSTCIICVMSTLFQECYSGKKDPFSPCQFLHAVWTCCECFADLQQHDAEEFLIALLGVMNGCCLKENSVCSSYSNQNIVRQLFSGRYQSSVICHTCKYVSSTVEFFWDVALDLGDVVKNSTELGSLECCLQRFTNENPLDGSSCGHCNERKRSKQITFLKLPYIMSFQLKRFSGTKKQQRKIDTLISFPEVLDMTPYLCYNLNEECFKSGDAIRNSDNKYRLFGVIEHRGKSLGSGHYVAHIMHCENQWFECSDDVITRTNISKVQNSQGYLLFYHKLVVEYQ